MSFAADASTKEAAQIQASAILSRLEQAKNKGQVRSEAAVEHSAPDADAHGAVYSCLVACFAGNICAQSFKPHTSGMARCCRSQMAMHVSLVFFAEIEDKQHGSPGAHITVM